MIMLNLTQIGFILGQIKENHKFRCTIWIFLFLTVLIETIILLKLWLVLMNIIEIVLVWKVIVDSHMAILILILKVWIVTILSMALIKMILMLIWIK